MPRYKDAHLTWNDRSTIEKMLREGYSKPQIARYLGVHHSTIYDECRRGAVELKRSDLTTYISYSADVAKDDHLERKLGTATFREMFKSITVDNGSEFADCKGMEASCKARGEARTHLYYCHPRSPGERGSNEKQNQLIRWFFPKGTDFRKVSTKKVCQVQDWINNYPRLILGWHTSTELFGVFLASL